jgi:hypothetical protein
VPREKPLSIIVDIFTQRYASIINDIVTGALAPRTKSARRSNSNKDDKRPVTAGRTGVAVPLQRMLVEHGRL